MVTLHCQISPGLCWPTPHTSCQSVTTALSRLSVVMDDQNKKTRFLPASLTSFSLQTLHVIKALTSSLIQFENLCLQNHFFSFFSGSFLHSIYGLSCSGTASAWVTVKKPHKNNLHLVWKISHTVAAHCGISQCHHMPATVASSGWNECQVFMTFM